MMARSSSPASCSSRRSGIREPIPSSPGCSGSGSPPSSSARFYWAPPAQGFLGRVQPHPLLPRADGLGLLRRLRRRRGLERALPRRRREPRPRPRRRGGGRARAPLRAARHRHRRHLGARSSGAPTGTGTRARPRSSSRCSSTPPTWPCAARSRTARRARRLAAAYAVLGLVVAPFFFFVAAAAQLLAPPRAGGQRRGQGRDGAAHAAAVLLAGAAGFTALFFWMHNLRVPRSARSPERRRASLSRARSRPDRGGHRPGSWRSTWSSGPASSSTCCASSAGSTRPGERTDEQQTRLLRRSAASCCSPSPASRSPRSAARLTPYVSLRARRARHDRTVQVAGASRRAARELRRRRQRAALHPRASPRPARRLAGALPRPAAGQLRGRDHDRGDRPLRRARRASSRPTSCWSSARASTRAPRSKTYLRLSADARRWTLSQLYLPGALALWCALALRARLALGLRRPVAARRRVGARRFARRAYRFFALSIVARRAGARLSARCAATSASSTSPSTRGSTCRCTTSSRPSGPARRGAS